MALVVVCAIIKALTLTVVPVVHSEVKGCWGSQLKWQLPKVAPAGTSVKMTLLIKQHSRLQGEAVNGVVLEITSHWIM